MLASLFDNCTPTTYSSESGEDESLSLAITLASSLIRISDLEEHHLEGELGIGIVPEGFASRVDDLKYFTKSGSWYPSCQG